MNRKRTIDTVLTAVGVATAAGLVIFAAPGQATGQSSGGSTNLAGLPMELSLTGVVRDFKARELTGGHPDFQRQPAGGFGHYVNNISRQLDSDGKPVFVGGGRKIGTQWRDSSGRNIFVGMFDQTRGDQAGAYSGGVDNGGITSADSFRQWFRDVPGVNTSQALTLTLRRAADSALYTFDDRRDPNFNTLGGFFPINGQLFGNYGSTGKNFHFTFELATEFVYRPGENQRFTFRGDDDVWVFVNGQMVIDLGGVHGAIEQTVHLDRLNFLRPNQTNTLHFFFAERHTTQSNFRIETTINLRNAELPNTSKLYD